MVLLTGIGVSSYFAIEATQQAEQSQKNETVAVAAKTDLEKANEKLAGLVKPKEG